jgi:hypothetical protein
MGKAAGSLAGARADKGCGWSGGLVKIGRRLDSRNDDE